MVFPPPERFPALDALDGFAHGFTVRCPGIDVAVDKVEALGRLKRHFQSGIEAVGFSLSDLVTAEQVHEAAIAVADGNTDRGKPLAGFDGLICGEPGTLLGIYVADCCAVYVVDPVGGSFGLVHSGKKGTSLGIVPRAIEALNREFGANPGDLRVHLSPCIRPPDYEVDFAAEIRGQCLDCGVPEKAIVDGGVSTAKEIGRYYSYRVENGKTGRMLALLGRIS